MAKQASKTIIGVFVVSSIAMLIAGVILFGSGDLFKEKIKYVMFFEDSVKGLSVGAPVIWRGVQIGSVSSIVLRADTRKLTVDVPVFIEVDPSRFEIIGQRSANPREMLKHLIAKGLRARLAVQSFVTGSSMIELAFLPKTPVRLTGLERRYPEVPTVRSPISKLTQKLEHLPIEEIAGKLVDILDNIDGLLKDPEIKEMAHNLNNASLKLNGVLEDANKMVSDANHQVNTISENINTKMTALSNDTQTTMKEAQKMLQNASSDLNGVSRDARKLLQEVSGEIKPIVENIQSVLVMARKALDGLTPGTSWTARWMRFQGLPNRSNP
ncbi:MAG: MlaD family protein [Deltaproteobacteria bacterium]